MTDRELEICDDCITDASDAMESAKRHLLVLIHRLERSKTRGAKTMAGATLDLLQKAQDKINAIAIY